MGSFLGHVVPGTMFIIYAMWTLLHVVRRYFRCKRANIQFISSIWYPCDFCDCCKTFPTEAVLKFILAFIGIIGELYTGMENGRFVYFGNGHHITMFFFFGFTGVMDLLYYYKCPLPPGIDYAINCLAFYVEGILFKYHLYGRSDLDIAVHTYLVYCIIVCALAVIAEAVFRNNVLVALVRPYFTMLQGMWLIQIGFILYNPLPGDSTWNSEDATNLSLATFAFVSQSAGLFIFVIVITALCARFYKNPSSNFEIKSNPLIGTGLIKDDNSR